MSLEGRRKAEKVTKCGGGGDIMCCPIGSEMWICILFNSKKKLAIRETFIVISMS